MHATLISGDAKQNCKHDDNGVHLWTAGHRAEESMEWEWWLTRRRGYDWEKLPMDVQYREISWGPKQPDNAGGHENCLYVDSDFKEYDETCETSRCFVCDSRDK